MIKRNKIPTILGIVLLVAATFAGVFLVNYKQIFRIGATGESEPNNIRVSNIADSSLTVSWTTDKETSGFLVLDEGNTSADERGFTHAINLTGLKPNTSYDYKINSNSIFFDNNGIPWQAKTLVGAPPETNPAIVSGSVLTATGQPVKKALVYVNAESQLFSTFTSDSGNYVIKLPNADPANTLIEISVQAGPAGVSSAQIYPQSAKPVPPIILGSTHDFKSLSPSGDGQVPGASLNLPSELNQESKFNIPENGTPTSSGTVTLESVDEGETVTSTQPEFFGDGPARAELTIKIESENPITDNINVGSGGSWNWSPPNNLTPGAHKVTITWKDISGITRSLTRNFIVQAGEAPAFEASGSAQTTTPSPTPNVSPTPSPSFSPTPSSAPVPQTGSLTPTLLLFATGLEIIIFSSYVWRLAVDN